MPSSLHDEPPPQQHAAGPRPGAASSPRNQAQPARHLGAPGALLADRRGATFLEYLVLVAIVALGAISAFRSLNSGLSDAASQESERIVTLTAASAATAPGALGASESGDASDPGASVASDPAASPTQDAASPPAPKPKGKSIGQKIGDFFKNLGKKIWGVIKDFTPLGDIITLLDPKASALDKALAGAGLAASFIPGAGPAIKGAAAVAKTATKGAKKADDAAQAAKGAGGTRSAGKADDPKKPDEAKKPDDGALAAAGKNEKKKDDPQDCPNGVCKNGTCFPAGTPVHTQEGPRPIEQVREGDLLFSRDDRTGEVALRRVISRFVTPSQALLGITLDVGDGLPESLRVTAPHPFWTRRGWVAARDLTLDDEVMLLSGAWASVTGAATLDASETVYNFEVEGFHTYFVGDAGAWVHNQGGECGPVVRTDDRPFDPTGKTPDRVKSHVDPDGNLVPANPNGKATIVDHIRGSEPRKSDSPYTSFTESGDQAKSYGSSTIKVDTARLAEDIRSGKVKDVEIIDNASLLKHLDDAVASKQKELDAATTKKKIEKAEKSLENAKRDRSNAERDRETLIKGTVPADYVKVSP